MTNEERPLGCPFYGASTIVSMKIVLALLSALIIYSYRKGEQ